MAAIWSLTILSILMVLARIYTQHFVSRQLGLSDALVVLATVSSSTIYLYTPHSALAYVE